MATTDDDLLAMRRELEAQLASAPPEMRALLEQQIQALDHAAGMLSAAAPAIAEQRSRRPDLTPELRAFFTPSPPAPVPVWIPDDTTRASVTPELLRCPPEAKVYTLDDSIGCAIPRGGGIPTPHGLTLSFWASGSLAAQRYYEHGLTRWAVEYHPSGGRASIGFWIDREPKVYLEQGLHTAYHPSGVVSSESCWENGVRHGWTKLWEDDGCPIGATLYEHGRQGEQILPDGTRR
jgi:hypothetical protein